MKLIFKNFTHLIRRFKSSAILNVLGLSVAFAVSIIIAIQVYYDATYNHCFEKADDIATIRFYTPFDDYEGETISMPYAKELVDKIPEIKNYAITMNRGKIDFDLTAEGSSSPISIDLLRVREGFIDMFAPKIIRGSAVDILTDNSKVVITVNTAERLFGDEDPIGKAIYYHYDKRPLEIVAICEDYPKNSTFRSDAYVNLPFNESESEWSYRMYVELQPGTHDIVTEKLNSEEIIGEENFARVKNHPEEEQIRRVVPIKDIYMLQGSNKTTFLALIIIGIIVLGIAYINYFNFAVAMAPSRIRSINIHKILGISKTKLYAIILFEGVFLALIAITLSILMVYAFASSILSSFFAADLSISQNILMVGIIIALFIVFIIIVGIYPARYTSSFPEAVALNSSFALSPKGGRLRNILILIQFTAAIAISCVALYIKIQHSYMQNYSIGIQRENIVYLPKAGLDTDIYTFGEEMKRNPNIIDYTASEFVPGNIMMGWGRPFEGKQVRLASWPVIPGFLEFFDVKVIAGDNFSPVRNDSTSLEQVIVNNQFLERYEFDNSIIGKDFPTFTGGILVGIAGDVNFQSLHTSIEPMAFVVLNNSYRDNRLNYIFFKISGRDIGQTTGYMQQTWNKFSKEDFNLKFLDQEMDNLYKKENDMAKLIALFGLVIIIIAIMGVYGLIIFNTRFKVREIAIRKVNGSTVSEVMVVLNRSMLLLLPAAFIISVIIAWIAINKWGEQFAYKAPASWWLFVVAGVLVALITVATVSWQSWRAATANPVKALKNE